MFVIEAIVLTLAKLATQVVEGQWKILPAQACHPTKPMRDSNLMLVLLTTKGNKQQSCFDATRHSPVATKLERKEPRLSRTLGLSRTPWEGKGDKAL
jgi:hypothetical protein